VDSYAEIRRRRYEKRTTLRHLWRTPEKQYVRKFGWLPVAQARNQMLARPLRYFTLPGEEALDILFFHGQGLLQKTNRGFPDIGICEVDSDILAEAMQKLKFVGRQRCGKFEDVAKESDFLEWFNYDVVNLDFTSVPFPDGESPFEGTWGAIEKVVESQARHRQPFDLFLTFRGDISGTNQAALQELLENLRKNLDNRSRRDALQRRIGHLDINRLLQQNYPEFLLVALPKLVVGLAVNNNFACPTTTSYYYARTGDEGTTYKIIKFVFSVDLPAQGKKSLSHHPQLVETYEEGVLHSFASVPIDVDSELNTKPDLRKELVAEAQHLQW
jgi:hypothetical protein